MSKHLRLPLLLLAICALGGVGVSVGQQPPQARVSPQDIVRAAIDGTEITLVYSRPNLKDSRSGETRKIWGGLVPYGQIWRTGANEATLLTTQAPLQFGNGGATVPAGTYSVFTLPEEGGGAKLIINKQTGQWGTKYDEKQDLVRVDLKKSSLEKPVDQFTMAIEKNPAGGNGGVLKMTWETTEYSVPFTIKK